MYKKHNIFKEPSDKNVKIWRYFDFAKFISLLETKSLWFTRADKLEDPFEGSFPKSNIRYRSKIYKDIPSKKLPLISEFFRNLRQHTFLNCWHENEHESAAMWDLYSRNNEGIAIQSTFQRLSDCFRDYKKEDIFIGKVTYIDYQRDWMPENNSFFPFIHKRKSFEHEKEIRALVQHFNLDKKTGKITLAIDMASNGLMVPVDIALLIENIYVSPKSPKWIYELVTSLLKRYDFRDKEVNRSYLAEKPLF